MKVCFAGVSDSFPSYAGENTRVMELANNLLELGVEVHIVVPRRKPHQFTEFFRGNRCRAIIHEAKVRLSLPKFDYVFTLVSQLRLLARLQKSECFDLIHTNMLWGGPIGLAAKKTLGVPVVFDPHDWFFGDLFDNPLMNDAVERLCAIKLDATLVTGSRLERFVTTRGVPPEKLFVVPNGVRKEVITYSRPQEHEVAKARNALRIKESEGIVTFLGSLEYYQGVDILIRAMKYVTEHVNSKLIVIGKGTERSHLETLSGNLGLAGNIIFLSNVPWAYLIKLLDISSVAVVPFRANRYTAWIQPIKVFEYSARGKPVIASNLPGISEIIKDRVNGLLVRPEDTSMLSEALVNLLTDDAAGRKMGESGRRMVTDKYTWSRNAGKLKKVYERVL